MKLSDIKANPWTQPHVPEMYEGVGEGPYPAPGTFGNEGSLSASRKRWLRIKWQLDGIREWVALRIAPWLRE